jgi:hypothetical protein
VRRPTDLAPGIQNAGTWIRGVRLTKAPNRYVQAGTPGDLEVLEVAIDRAVLYARFHLHGEGRGFSVVLHPEWEPLPPEAVAAGGVL